MSIFDDLKGALATVMNTDPTTAGFVLGLTLIVALLIGLVWVLGDSLKGSAIFVPIAIAIAFVALVGWWPPWTIIFMALVLAFVIFNPFREGSVGGGM